MQATCLLDEDGRAEAQRQVDGIAGPRVYVQRLPSHQGALMLGRQHHARMVGRVLQLSDAHHAHLQQEVCSAPHWVKTPYLALA